MLDDYARAVLSAYLALPGTPARTSPFDRCLARSLRDRAVPLDTVTVAFSLAIARRYARPKTAVPLGAIRSLAYFLPVIDELLASPIHPRYADYICRKARSLPVSPSP
jgi:hypothetical protein